MKIKSWLIIGIDIVFLLIACGLILFINSYNYNNIYLSYINEQLNKSQKDYIDNKEYFDICVGSLKDKYESYSVFESDKTNKTISGVIRLNGDSLVLMPEDNSICYINNLKKPDDLMNSESANAFIYILKNLGYCTIKYCMTEDGQYYLYFCKEGMMKRPFFCVSDNNGSENAESYGLFYSSDSKAAPEKVKEISPNWYISYEKL